MEIKRTVPPIAVFVGDHKLTGCHAFAVRHQIKTLAAVVEHCRAALPQRVLVQRQIFRFERHGCIALNQKLKIVQRGVANSHDSRCRRLRHTFS
jgi:hypothetical protein